MGQYQYSLTLSLTLRTQDYFSLCHKERHDSIFNQTNFWQKKMMKKIDEKKLSLDMYANSGVERMERRTNTKLGIQMHMETEINNL